MVAKILSEIEPKRLDAIKSIKYRTYFTASLFFPEKLKRSFYNLMFLEPMETDLNDVVKASRLQRVTDIIYSNFLKENTRNEDVNFTIINLYRTFPYEAEELLRDDFYKVIQYEFEDQIQKTILPMLAKINDCKQCLDYSGKLDLRIHRWTNALPLPEVGTISSGKVDLLRKPFKDRVFFAEQGNWCLPSVESGFAEAHEMSFQIKKLLLKK